ncbi:MAG: GntR family transcriptional regulator [Betaproteobacteria bacterium]
MAPDLVEQVYAALVKAIGSGALAPGDRVTQEQLARQFKVSRQPVLQALRLLRRDGLLCDAPGRGVLIAPLDANSLRWVYQLRGALDDLAVSLAAAQRARIDPTLIRDGRNALARSNLPDLIDADVAFHSALYQASGNPMILEAAGRHWSHIRRAMGVFLLGEHAPRIVWDEHAAIAEAVAAGEVERARQLSQTHTHRASEAMVAQLEVRHRCAHGAAAEALDRSQTEALDRSKPEALRRGPSEAA